jgi:hypothetical protein
MQDSTPAETETWQARCDRLGVDAPMLAKVTGANVFTIRAYRLERFNPSPEWLEKVDKLLTAIETAASTEATA